MQTHSDNVQPLFWTAGMSRESTLDPSLGVRSTDLSGRLILRPASQLNDDDELVGD